MTARNKPVVRPDRADEGTGYQLTRFNAIQHGVLSRYTILPWENESEYLDLLHALADEHRPSSPTEEHLVEELAGVLWRKRRLRLAEAAAFRHGLSGTQSGYFGNTANAALSHLSASVSQTDVAAAVHASPEDTLAELVDLSADIAQSSEAMRLLQDEVDAAYDKALAVLREDTQGWWGEVLVESNEERDPYRPDAASLVRFLQEEVADWYENRRTELQHRPLIQSQAYGEALAPDRLEKLSRYEVHLDRKLERTLAMLLKLQDLRRPSPSGLDE